MDSMTVLVLCLRVNLPEGEWWLDLPELTSILIGKDAFLFSGGSSELIMRSDDDDMRWWIDLPKLASLVTTRISHTFMHVGRITLEGTSYHSILTSRHSLSHQCCSCWEVYLQKLGIHSCQEFLFLLLLMPRHHSRSPAVYPLHCFLRTLLVSTLPSTRQLHRARSHRRTT